MSLDGALISDVCAALSGGVPACFLVTGPARTGKSWLLEELRTGLHVTRPDAAVLSMSSPYHVLTLPTAAAESACALLLDDGDIVGEMLAALGQLDVLMRLAERIRATGGVFVCATRCVMPPPWLTRIWAAPTPFTLPTTLGPVAFFRACRRASVPEGGERTHCDISLRAALVHSPPELTNGIATAATQARRTLAGGLAPFVRTLPAGECSRQATLCGVTEQLVELTRILRAHHGPTSSGSVARTMRSSTGVLLYGPHGCGKSLLAVLCAESVPQLPFFFVSAPTLFSKFLGETEERLRAVFAAARAAQPSVLVIDNIESIALSRRKSDGTASDRADVNKRVLAALLCEMDGVDDGGRVLVIGASARPGDIDSALLRQGRLESLLHVGPPDGHVTFSMVEARLAAYSFSSSEERRDAATTMAAASAGCSPAAVALLCRGVLELVVEQYGSEAPARCSAEIVRTAIANVQRQLKPVRDVVLTPTK
jgi:hypothetical protein